MFDKSFKIDEIPPNIIFEDSEKLKYIRISSYENDLLDKNLRKKIFLYFLEMKVPHLNYVKYNKRTYNLCLKYMITTMRNYGYVKKRYLKLIFIKKVLQKNKGSFVLDISSQRRKLKTNLSYYYF
jgi:hypothetical protein